MANGEGLSVHKENRNKNGLSWCDYKADKLKLQGSMRILVIKPGCTYSSCETYIQIILNWFKWHQQ